MERITEAELRREIEALYTPPEPKGLDEFEVKEAAKIWKVTIRCATMKLVQMLEDGQVTRREGVSENGRRLHYYRLVRR